MATNGSLSISDLYNRYIFLEWTVKSSDREKRQTTISWLLTSNAANSYKASNLKAVINGKTVYSQSKLQTVPAGNGKKLASGTLVVQHAADGTKVLTASLGGKIGASSYDLWDDEASSFWLLPSLSDNATVYQSITGTTETTATVKWTSDATISGLWVTLDNGSNWTSLGNPNAANGRYTITGLNAKSSYTIKTKVQKKGTNLTTISNASVAKTYDYPHCTGGNDFVIGEKCLLHMYNPLNRTITVKLYYKGGGYFSQTVQGSNDPNIGGTNINGDEYVKVTGTAAKNALYASIPNNTSYRYDIEVDYGEVTRTLVEAGHYSVNAKECSPEIETVGYQDINASTIAITNDRKLIIQNQSTVEFYTLGLTAKKSASVKSCTVKVAGQTFNLTVSGTAASGGNASLRASYNTDAVFTLTDSRGLTATRTVTVNILSWSLPTALITLQRRDNYYSETYLTVNARYSSLNGANLLLIEYKARKTGTSSWTINGTTTSGTTVNLTMDNTKMWDVVVTLTDLFGTTTYNLKLSRGTPIIYFDYLKSSVGVNCFPSANESFEVGGHDLFGEMYYKSGDTATLSDFCCAGYTTSSNKKLRFTVPLPKAISGVTPTVTKLVIVARHSDGGYTLDNSATAHDVINDASLTLTVSMPTGQPRMLQMDVESTTAFNGTNNTPQAVWITDLGLTFS